MSATAKATTPQPYALYLPAGTLLYSAIVTHHRLSGHGRRSTTLERLTGEARGEAHNPFETRAPQLAGALLSQTDRGQELLLGNSVVGFYVRALHENVEAEVLRELLNGNRSVAAMYLKSSQHGELCSATLKWCKTCAALDLAQDGTTHWYVVHQLPIVTHCHRHYIPLIHSCEKCQTRPDNGRRWMLPGDSCSCIRKVVGSSAVGGKVLKEDDPYRQFLEVVESAFTGQAPQIRPPAWRKNVAALVDEYGSVERARDKLAASLLRTWSKSQEQGLASQLTALVFDGGLERELQLLARPREVLLRLALLRCASEVLHADVQSPSKGTPPGQGYASQLVDHLERQGIPAGAAAMLRVGSPMLEIARAIRTDTGVLLRVLSSLPNHLHDELTAARMSAGTRRAKPATPFNLPSRLVAEDEKRVVLRQKIRYLIDVVGLTRRGQITALLGSARTWMLKNDREWLDQNLPGKSLKVRPRRGEVNEG